MKENKQNINLSLLGLFIVLTLMVLLAINSIYQNFKEHRENDRREYLEQNLQKATLEFKEGIEQYAILTSGIRSHIITNNREPEDIEVQQYIVNQLQFTDYAHSIIINYFDTSHTFVFSISEDDLTPNQLRGVQLSTIRDSSTIARMDALLNSESIVAFPPVNLYEGFVGFPIDFRVLIDNKVVGYIAPLIDIKNLIDPIIQKDINSEFTYQFSYGDGIKFDRERVYNNTEVHHSRVDETNLNLSDESYISESFDVYGMKFNIGVAFREEEANDILQAFTVTSYIVVLSLIGLSMLLLYLFFHMMQNRNMLRISNNELSIKNSILKKYVYAASHDIKQPIINIKNFQNLLIKKHLSSLDPPSQEYVHVISDNLEYLEAMLDDFLIYANILKRENKVEDVDLNAVVDEVRQLFLNPKIDFAVQPLPKISGNKSQLSRLFQNLFSNAIKFNENDVPKIRISCSANGKFVEIKVSDDGIGIPKDQIPLIFVEFQRLQKEKYEGTGLGLTICKEIVANHGGEIRGEQNEQGGTDIIFTLKK